MTTHADKCRPAYKRIAPECGGRWTYKLVKGPGGAVKHRITDANVVPHNPKLLLAPVGFEYVYDGQINIKERGSANDAWHSNIEISRCANTSLAPAASIEPYS